MRSTGNKWWRLKTIAVAIVCSAVVNNGAVAAYLPKVGPSSLRFQLPQPMLATLLLPPLKMSDEVIATNAPAASVNEAVAAATNSVPDNAGVFVGPPAPKVVFADPINATNPPVQVDNGPVVTPQMLLQFFTPGTANTNAVVVPAPFQLPESPRSSATYNSK